MGQAVSTTDRNGTTHTLAYDVLGRVVVDTVTTLGSGVDGAVRRIETAYDGQGNVLRVTSYDATSGGTILNQILRDHNVVGQMITEWQSHSGVVVSATTPKVQYGFNFNGSGTVNQARLATLTYPSGYAVTLNYSSGLNWAISRLSSLTDSGGTLESYDFLGLGGVIKRAHPQPGVDQTFIGTPGDGGDQYAGLDRFGRVVDLLWVDTSGPTTLDQFQYGYDEVGNRKYRDNLVDSTFGELYSYDDLNQLTGFERGTLNGTKDGLTGSASRSQDWDFDALGNWESLTTDGGAVNRNHNAQNEITGIEGATTPTYDANGNMTTDETGRQFVYDAWNRLVTVKNSGGTTLKTYGYDGLNRRITETVTATSVTTDLYYSNQWQVLEERVSGATTQRYVWSPVYVDALVLRERDTDANGSLDERLYALQDANWNVTTLVDTSGTVVERYVYDAFGAVTVLDANWAADADGVSDVGWVYTWQGRPADTISATYYFRNRDVSPTLGRPTQVDMIRFGSGDVNFYRWEGNGPVSTIDPTGQAPPSMQPKSQAQAALEELRAVQRKKDIELTDNAIRHIIQNSRAYNNEEKAIIIDAVLALVRAARFEWNKSVGLVGKCYDWVDEYKSNRQAGKLLTELRAKGVIGRYIVVDQQVWYNKLLLGSSTGFGHTAIRITLSSGTIFYVDDGNLGGLDQVFMQKEVPSRYDPQNGKAFGFKPPPPKGSTPYFNGTFPDTVDPVHELRERLKREREQDMRHEKSNEERQRQDRIRPVIG